MGMNLDEVLAEVDEWKRAVGDEMAGLSILERHERDRQAVSWLEKQLGKELPRETTPRRSAMPVPEM
ncbi:MAG: hypothetical protein HOP29_18225 [Phycisphaerales bacterium]|nr:hypothetical protein [Phycisphaerales bacterium]